MTIVHTRNQAKFWAGQQCTKIAPKLTRIAPNFAFAALSNFLAIPGGRYFRGSRASAALYTYHQKWSNNRNETLIKGVLNSTFSHNSANTLHGRRSALALHSFVWGVLRQLSIRFSPPGSGHVSQYEPPYPKIGSKSTFCTIWSSCCYRHQKHPITRVAAPGKLAHFVDGMIRQLSVGRLPPQRVHVPRHAA